MAKKKSGRDLRKRVRARSKSAFAELDSAVAKLESAAPKDTTKTPKKKAASKKPGVKKKTITATLKGGKAVGLKGKAKDEAETLFKLLKARRKTMSYGGVSGVNKLVKSKKMDPKHPAATAATAADSLSKRLNTLRRPGKARK